MRFVPVNPEPPTEAELFAAAELMASVGGGTDRCYTDPPNIVVHWFPAESKTGDPCYCGDTRLPERA